MEGVQVASVVLASALTLAALYSLYVMFRKFVEPGVWRLEALLYTLVLPLGVLLTAMIYISGFAVYQVGWNETTTVINSTTGEQVVTRVPLYGENPYARLFWIPVGIAVVNLVLFVGFALLQVVRSYTR